MTSLDLRTHLTSGGVFHLDLRHLEALTDDTGILQHAVFNMPNRKEGYCTDDNARALILVVMLESRGLLPRNASHGYVGTYFSFIWDAFNDENQRFRNFMSYSHIWIERVGSDESHARALWALGSVIRLSKNDGLVGAAERLWVKSLDAISSFESSRADAIAIFGLVEYVVVRADARAVDLIRTLGSRLVGLYRENSDSGWRWFDDKLTYFNARLPHALLLAGEVLSDREMLDVGLQTLEWLVTIQKDPQGYFAPVGSNGFWPRRGARAWFDQQPIDAYATLSACIVASRITKNQLWTDEINLAFNWFLGCNHLQLPVYDFSTGGCRDGVHKDRLNQNQGAESTLAYLLSLAELENYGTIKIQQNADSERDGIHREP